MMIFLDNVFGLDTETTKYLVHATAIAVEITPTVRAKRQKPWILMPAI